MADRMARAAATQPSEGAETTLLQGKMLAEMGSRDLARTMYQQHLATRTWDPRIVDALRTEQFVIAASLTAGVRFVWGTNLLSALHHQP